MKQTIPITVITGMLAFLLTAGCNKQDKNEPVPDFVCGTSTVEDIDGNSYNTVLIGDQCWMKENLKTTHYRNGTPIEYPGDDNAAWENNKAGAYAWFLNEEYWKDMFGAMYNWYAVKNSNVLCPTGWQVPNDTEWAQLVDYVILQGYPNIENEPNGAANALKSCRQWDSPLGEGCHGVPNPRWHSHNIHFGFDAFGFSALPGGIRSSNGQFYGLQLIGAYWMSSEYSSTHAIYHQLSFQNSRVNRYSDYKSHGFFIRCLKD